MASSDDSKQAHLAGPCRVHGEVQIAVEPAERIPHSFIMSKRVHMQEAAPIKLHMKRVTHMPSPYS